MYAIYIFVSLSSVFSLLFSTTRLYSCVMFETSLNAFCFFITRSSGMKKW